MKLLVSVISVKEARRCVEEGIDIIDVKNPREGSLGGHTPFVVKKIRGVVPGHLQLSAAIGDITNKPGLVSQAALGLAVCGVEYIKLGLCDNFSEKDASTLVKEVVRTVKGVDKKIKVVVCGYADAQPRRLIHPSRIPAVTYKSGADIAMIDTLTKGNNKGIFDFLSEKEINAFCIKAHSYGLKVALAGSLKKDDVLKIRSRLCCDIVGVRGLACEGGRREADVKKSRLKEIKQLLVNP